MDATNTTELNALLNRLLDEAEGGSAPAEGGETADPPPPAVPSDTALAVSAAETSASPIAPSAAPLAASPAANPLGGLLSNPALLTALPTLLENAGPFLSSLSGGVGSGASATRPHTIDRHTALLCAVKPYLSPERQSAAETVIRLCRIWDALERSGISLTGLLGTAPLGATAPKDGR